MDIKKHTFFYCLQRFGYFLFVIVIFHNSTALAGEVNLPMTHLPAGGLYLHAVLENEVVTQMLVDTGSSYVALSKPTFDKLNDTAELEFSRYIYAAMANGRIEQAPLYLLRELRLADNCVLRNIEVAVLLNDSRDIIGLNALQLLEPFTLKLTPPALTSQNCST